MPAYQCLSIDASVSASQRAASWPDELPKCSEHYLAPT